jgi:hypothetical protein
MAEKQLSISVWRHCVGPPYLVDEYETEMALNCTFGTLRGAGEKSSDDLNCEAVNAISLGRYLDEEIGKVVSARRAKLVNSAVGAGHSFGFVLCTSHDLAPPCTHPSSGTESGWGLPRVEGFREGLQGVGGGHSREVINTRRTFRRARL